MVLRAALLNYGSVMTIDFDRAVKALGGLKRKHVEPGVVITSNLDPAIKLANVCAQQFGDDVDVVETDLLEPPKYKGEGIQHAGCLSFVEEFVAAHMRGINNHAQTVLFVTNRYALVNLAIGLDCFDEAQLPLYHGLILDFSNDWNWGENLERVTPFSAATTGVQLDQF